MDARRYSSWFARERGLDDDALVSLRCIKATAHPHLHVVLQQIGLMNQVWYAVILSIFQS